MNKHNFEYIKTVAECGSITKAANKLYISQPALSKYISRLEEELGVQLFDRTLQPLVLTYAGEQYLTHLKSILMEIDNMKKKFRDLSNQFYGRLRVGFPNERAVNMLPEILPRFKHLFPGIQVEVMTAPGDQLVQSLRDGELEFFFLPMWEEQKDLEQVEILREELVLVTEKGYLDQSYLLDVENKIFDWDRIGELPLLTLKEGHSLRKSVEVLLRNKNIRPNIVLETNSNMLTCRLAAKGVGVAVVPEITLTMLNMEHDVDCYHLSSHTVEWQIFAVYRKAGYLGEVERAFLDIAVEAFKK
ncbi:LysR family transcriptional regulator [Lacrimispora sp.]|uniref:LysR family transcriptional regulator n=1 Tax=Lacrimispora sp. TaxID=2719234 RepID=UPI00346138B6